MKNAPCYECEKRTTVCHANCVAYRDWKAELDRQHEKRRATADADTHIKATIERNCKRAQTKRRVGQK